MQTAIQKAEDGTITLTITIPSADVKKTREHVVEQIAQSANIAGFRKGKAPKDLVEDKVNEEQVREEVLKKLLPEFYVQAVQEHKLNPILNPKIHIEKLEEGKDWQFSAQTCEMPNVELGDYKKRVGAVTAKGKIVVPGKEQKEASLDEIVEALLDGIKVMIPAVLLNQEVDRMLAQMLDDVKKLGMSLDQYLASTGRTAEQLRDEYAKRAETDLKLEFALQKVADDANIQVDEKELDEAIMKAKTDTERAQMEANKYVLANILRQQKTFDFLKNL